MTILKDKSGNPQGVIGKSQAAWSDCWIWAARSLRLIGQIPIGPTTKPIGITNAKTQRRAFSERGRLATPRSRWLLDASGCKYELPEQLLTPDLLCIPGCPVSQLQCIVKSSGSVLAKVNG
jgi:hypothetical protein